MKPPTGLRAKPRPISSTNSARRRTPASRRQGKRDDRRGGGHAPKISLIVITRNEEELIGQCLESAAAFCDELIVVDSFSTDRTVEIARGLGARVFQRTFDGYIAQKQFALEQASGEWVFSLDADEQATWELGSEIRATLAASAAGRRLPRPPRALPSRPLLHARTLSGLALAAVSPRARALRRTRTACQRADRSIGKCRGTRRQAPRADSPFQLSRHRGPRRHDQSAELAGGGRGASRARSPWSR